jgi:hypothetical protein
LTPPTFVLVLLIATYLLTIWQARWGYFFVLIFALALPHLLEAVKWRGAVWIAFFLSIFPIARDWDQRLWPSETELALRVEQRSEVVQLRDLALSLRSTEIRPLLAPWWLDGIADSARFFLCDDWQKARQILQNHRVDWVFAYDSERVAQNSAAILSQAAAAFPLCRMLDRTPSQVPPFLIFASQNGTCKLYRAIAE